MTAKSDESGAEPAELLDAAPRTVQRNDEPSADEPPIVARLVVEIRSDGRRTIARGALEDRIEDQRVGVQIDTSSPLSLALSLARALLQIPQIKSRVGRSWVSKARRGRLPGLSRRPAEPDAVD